MAKIKTLTPEFTMTYMLGDPDLLGKEGFHCLNKPNQNPHLASGDFDKWFKDFEDTLFDYCAVKTKDGNIICYNIYADEKDRPKGKPLQFTSAEELREELKAWFDQRRASL